MISQTAPRKSLMGIQIPKEKGFYIDGTDYADCVRQLKEYASQHPEKWIYIYDCGLGPGYPVPISRHLIEVSIYDAEPAAMMLFSRLFQAGCYCKREIDEMTPEEKLELRMKNAAFLAMLGSFVRNKEEGENTQNAVE